MSIDTDCLDSVSATVWISVLHTANPDEWSWENV